MKRLIWFLIPIMSWGQCDMEIIGFNPISTDMTIAVNGGNCGTAADSIGEFLLAISFTPPIEDVQDQFPCFYDDGWALLIFPLDFPGFDIGEGEDDMLQTGDTITFTLDEIPTFGSGTAYCWIEVMQSGAYFEECVILTVWQINDSQSITGSGGLGGFPYPDTNVWNSWVMWSLNGACAPPPPPIVYGCIDMFAYNYNSAATISDESCVYQGCQDPLALNYCPDCTIEGNCIYAPDDGDPNEEYDCNDPSIFVPNTFTPNNDGLNDKWRPITKQDCWWKWECRVYNRWGALVWVSYDPDDKWIGERLDSFVPDGVYTWTIKGSTWGSEKVVSMAGNVTVFR